LQMCPPESSYITIFHSVRLIPYLFYTHSLSHFFFFFFNDTAPTEIYTLSLHDALPISASACRPRPRRTSGASTAPARTPTGRRRDRKSTRLNSSHDQISYAVFCLKKKKKKKQHTNNKNDTITLITKTTIIASRRTLLQL